MKLRLDRLVLEITRECSMKCPHCMRGKAEKQSMEWDVIEEVFKNVTWIEHLLLTGGEPSLAHENIERIVRSAKRYNCGIAQ